jgi:hypothetical protein
MSKYFVIEDIDQMSREVHKSCKIFDNWKITDHLIGRGSYGKVLIACNDTKGKNEKPCEYVAKQIRFDFSRYDSEYVLNIFFAECLITQFAGQQGFGIPIHKFFLCDGESENRDTSWFGFGNSDPIKIKQGVVIMDKYDGDVETIKIDLTWDDMKQLIDKVTVMHDAGILHRDLFLKNTMYKNVDGKRDMRIIDFGLSIAFERSIPKPLRSIDYLNLISDIPNKELRSRCYKYILTILDTKSVKTGLLWLREHYDKCFSEYSLLKYLPVKWIRIMGPATVDTMVWSVRCNHDIDEDIVRRTKIRVDEVLHKF